MHSTLYCYISVLDSGHNNPRLCLVAWATQSAKSLLLEGMGLIWVPCPTLKNWDFYVAKQLLGLGCLFGANVGQTSALLHKLDAKTAVNICQNPTACVFEFTRNRIISKRSKLDAFCCRTLTPMIPSFFFQFVSVQGPAYIMFTILTVHAVSAFYIYI